MPFLLDHVSITVTDFDRAGRLLRRGLRRARRRAAAPFGGRACASASPASPASRSSRSSQSDDAHAGGPRHWAFRATSTAQVDAFHAAGLAAGGTDDGPPGPRPNYHERYYGAFLIDPDGNRVEAVCHEA